MEKNIHIEAKKKRMTIVVAVACAVCVIGLVFMSFEAQISELIDSAFNKETELVQLVYDGNGVHRISLYDPDWETNIFDVERWLEKNRCITYVDNGMAVTITDEAYDEYGICVEFMALYFKALMYGDADALCGFYADSYFIENERWAKITMQKVYDMRMELINTVYNQSEIIYVYKISYKIMENDGTFRDDVVSDAERAQFYSIVDTGDEIKITDVSYSYSVK